jgi:hypothetical protein
LRLQLRSLNRLINRRHNEAPPPLNRRGLAEPEKETGMVRAGEQPKSRLVRVVK